jgi:uncharacterized protein YodC (DUF2158 family)
MLPAKRLGVIYERKSRDTLLLPRPVCGETKYGNRVRDWRCREVEIRGPNMVIASEHPIEAGWVTCQWFDDKNELREKAFPKWALECGALQALQAEHNDI